MQVTETAAGPLPFDCLPAQGTWRLGRDVGGCRLKQYISISSAILWNYPPLAQLTRASHSNSYTRLVCCLNSPQRILSCRLAVDHEPTITRTQTKKDGYGRRLKIRPAMSMIWWYVASRTWSSCLVSRSPLQVFNPASSIIHMQSSP